MPRLTETDRKKIMADFHVGVNQNQLAAKYGCSKSTINNLCKGVTPLNIEKINTFVKIESDLMDQNAYNVRAVRTEVDKKLRDLEFFREASLVIALKARMKAEEENVSMFDLEKAQNIIGKGKENIYGKTPDTAIQINNGSENKKTDLSHLTLAEKLEIKRKVFKGE